MDDRTSDWFVAHRTPLLDSVSHWGTFLADTQGVVVVAVVVTAILVAQRWGRLAAMVLCGLALELAVFLTTNYAVRRPRPSVPHLGSTPSTFSFPSGHVAATIMLYGAIALLVAAASAHVVARGCAWTLAVLLPGWVGMSRVYAGQHHLFDVLAGVVMGLGALIAVAIAARLSMPVARGSKSPLPPSHDTGRESAHRQVDARAVSRAGSEQ
jgi:undecaprenyl-diphosphatase